MQRTIGQLLLSSGIFASVLLAAPAVSSNSNTRVVEVVFTPQGTAAGNGREALAPQIAVWLEQPDGTFVADLFVTRSVGLLGIGNRPGQALLYSDFRWPYGRRPMALPIWAHRRGKQYGYVVMGGACSTRYNPDNPRDTSCSNDFNGSPSDDDTTVAYHGPVSSNEPYFCSPSGSRTVNQNGVDVVSCASAFFGSKGWYAPGLTSPYPPRADLTMFGQNDHADARRFARDNDVAAISGATPVSGQPINPIRWCTKPEYPAGDFVLWVEVSREADFNASWTTGKGVPEPHAEWAKLGKDFIGQPSVVYKVPFTIDQNTHVATVSDYAGYGDWRGTSGTVTSPDGSISQTGGSGADRLKINSDADGSWRVHVKTGPCENDAIPPTPTALDLSDTTDATMTVRFSVPSPPALGIYEVRYRPDMPITDADFDQAYSARSIPIGIPGTSASTVITGLMPKTKYYVAVRPSNCCGQLGSIVTGTGQTTAAQFTTLSGCFIATAAWGSEMSGEVHTLRRFRDERLLKTPLGQAAVASYYALSPGLATVLSDSPQLRTWARKALIPVVSIAKAALSAAK